MTSATSKVLHELRTVSAELASARDKLRLAAINWAHQAPFDEIETWAGWKWGAQE